MAADTSSTGGKGIGGAFKSRLGPLPVWAWLAIMTAVALGFYLFEQHKKSSTASTANAGATPADVGQPGVVVINQDGPGGTGPAGPPGPPGPPGTKPPAEPVFGGNAKSQIVIAPGGQDLNKLAERYGIPEQQLEAFNPSLGRDVGTGRKIPKGTKLRIPAA
jgi:hypothetical protein